MVLLIDHIFLLPFLLPKIIIFAAMQTDRYLYLSQTNES